MEFIQNGDVVDDEYVELEASFADRFHGFVTGGTFDTVRVSVYGGDYIGLTMFVGFVEVPAPGVLALIGLGGHVDVAESEHTQPVLHPALTGRLNAFIT